MATADQLLELMFSWIEQRELCAEQLKKLAKELESLREKCNVGECVGSSVAVVGAGCLIVGGVATVLTGGVAGPFLGGLGALYTGTGVTISVATKITEHFLSSDTMKEAQKIEKRSNELEEKIQKLFKRLEAEVRRELGPSADPDQVDRHVMTEVLRAVARRSGLKSQIRLRMMYNELMFYYHVGSMSLDPILFKLKVLGLAGILGFFAYELSGKQTKILIAEGVEQLIKLTSSAGFKTVCKGGVMVRYLHSELYKMIHI